MLKALTKKQCQTILFNLGIKFGVSPKLISERLLSDLDKVDMMAGGVSIEALNAAIEAWMKAGMPDYANGQTSPREIKTECYLHAPQTPWQELPLRPPFARPSIEQIKAKVR